MSKEDRMTNPVEGVEAPLCVTCGERQLFVKHHDVTDRPWCRNAGCHPFQPPVSSTPDEGVAVEFKAVRDLLTETLARLEALAIPTSPPVAPREEGASRTPVETAVCQTCGHGGDDHASYPTNHPSGQVCEACNPREWQEWESDPARHPYKPVEEPTQAENALVEFVPPPAPTSEPPREEAGGWKRVGEIGHGDVHWRNEARDIDAIVPTAVEAAIRAPLEAEVARLREAAAYLRSVVEQIHRDSHDALTATETTGDLTPDEGGRLSEVSPSTEAPSEVSE